MKCMVGTKILDYFIKNSENLQYERLLRNRSFIGLVLAHILLYYLFLSARLIGFTVAPIFIGQVVASVVPLFLMKYVGDLKLAANSFILIIFVFLFFIIDDSGGIFSFNQKWLALVLLLTFFTSVNNIVVWGIICAVFISYFYIVDPNLPLEQIIPPSTEYLIDNVVFIFALGVIVALLFSLQKHMHDLLKKKNKMLETQKSKLESHAGELKEMTEQLKSTNKKLESFAYAASHDIKQPLRSIVSFSQLLQRDIVSGRVSDKTLSYVNYISDSGIRLNQTIDDILKSSKNALSNEDVVKQVSLERIIDTVCKELVVQLEESQAVISYQNLPTVYADQTQLKRVMQNLIMNSVKYSKKDQAPKIEITCVTDLDHMVVSVTDNGIGIDSEYQERVFDNFYQRDQIDGHTGQGIGLANCRRIVQEWGGVIWANSTLGEGSTFSFSIPIISDKNDDDNV